MKNATWAVIVAVLVLICGVQQLRIARQRQSPPASAAGGPPAMTYDVRLLSQSLREPDGAETADATGTRKSYQLDGSTLGNRGFEGCLWLNIAGVKFKGRSQTLREERVAAIAGFYAKQIAALIPGAVIESAMEAPSRAEAGALHSMCLIRHPHGVIVVSAGYTATTKADPQISDVIKVNVVSTNTDGNAHQSHMMSDDVLPNRR